MLCFDELKSEKFVKNILNPKNKGNGAFYYRHFTIPIVKRLYFLCKNSWDFKSAFYYRYS